MRENKRRRVSNFWQQLAVTPREVFACLQRRRTSSYPAGCDTSCHLRMLESSDDRSREDLLLDRRASDVKPAERGPSTGQKR